MTTPTATDRFYALKQARSEMETAAIRAAALVYRDEEAELAVLSKTFVADTWERVNEATMAAWAQAVPPESTKPVLCWETGCPHEVAHLSRYCEYHRFARAVERVAWCLIAIALGMVYYAIRRWG